MTSRGTCGGARLIKQHTERRRLFIVTLIYITYILLFALSLFALVGVDFQDGRLCDDDGTVFILLASIFSNTWGAQQQQRSQEE